MYAKTVFILNYDEGGQFVDHHWPPTPPMDATQGASTVTTEGELTKTEEFHIPAGHPIGLGWRVPLFLISPWSRGDYVFSEVSDHSSVVKFIEKRFNVTCPNISPWRRAVTSDLTAAFDWNTPNFTWPAKYPDTSSNVAESAKQCASNPPPTVPLVQAMPTQEPGTKLMRALPYSFDIVDAVDATERCGGGGAAAAAAAAAAASSTQRAARFGLAAMPSGVPSNITVVASASAGGMVCPAGFAISLGDLNKGVHGDYVALCVATTPIDALAPTTPLLRDIKAVLGDASACPAGYFGVDKHNSGTAQAVTICADVSAAASHPDVVLDVAYVLSAAGCPAGYTMDSVNMDSGAQVAGGECHLCVLRGAPPAAPDACLSLDLKHIGAVGATAGVFNVFDRSSPSAIAASPRTYTVEGGKSIRAQWDFSAKSGYEVRLHGPNGFVRIFQGDGASAPAEARVDYTPTVEGGALLFALSSADAATTFTVTDNAYGAAAQSVAVAKGGAGGSASVAIAASGNWYDVTLTSSAHAAWARRFMGRWETGATTTSDPAMAAAVPGLGRERAVAEGHHPPMHYETYRMGQVAYETFLREQCASRRSKAKDVCTVA